MWVSKYNKWHKNVLPLEKFLTERIIQRCDYNEVISNKHRTSNGYTQLKELIQLADLTFKRSRTIRSLIVLIEEATSPYVKQNIINDEIVRKYFTDLEHFVRKYPKDKLLTERKIPNLSELTKFSHQLKLFEIQLENHYFDALKKEISDFNYSDDREYQTRADYLSALVDLLIPYLIFRGYSIASINEVLISWLVHSYRPTAKRIFDFFHFKERAFHFVQCLGRPDAESEAFFQVLQQESKVSVRNV